MRYISILKGGQTVAEGNISEMDLDEIVFHMTGKRPETKSSTNLVKKKSISDEVVLDVESGSFPKVSGISMQVNKGEIVGIGGLDGQGQSEFIRAILAVEKRFGKIIYRGQETNFKSSADAISQDMALSPVTETLSQFFLFVRWLKIFMRLKLLRNHCLHHFSRGNYKLCPGCSRKVSPLSRDL